MGKLIEFFASIGFIFTFFGCFFGIWAFKDFICDMKKRLEIAEAKIEILEHKVEKEK